MKNEGGKREGAGRPKKDEADCTVTKSITIPKRISSKLDSLEGNRSAKIVRAITEFYKF